MEMMVCIGRSSVVAYQNAASQKLNPCQLGSPLPVTKCLISANEVNEEIYAGRSLKFVDRPIIWRDSQILVTRDYRPLFDPDGKIVGVIAAGFSRAPGARSEMDDLRAIICALESPELPNALFGGLQLPGAFLWELSGSQRAAQRLRRFLPPPLH